VAHPYDRSATHVGVAAPLTNHEACMNGFQRIQNPVLKLPLVAPSTLALDSTASFSFSFSIAGADCQITVPCSFNSIRNTLFSPDCHDADEYDISSLSIDQLPIP
jgi:hypothetical protein